MVAITLSIAAEYEDTYRPNTGTIIVLATIAGGPGRLGRVLRSNAMRRCPMCCYCAAYQTINEVKLSDGKKVRIHPGETIAVQLQLTPKRVPALLSTRTSVKPHGTHDNLQVTVNYASAFGGANHEQTKDVGVRFAPSLLNLVVALLCGSLFGTAAAQLLPGMWKGWKDTGQKALRGLLFALVAELFAMLLAALGSKFILIQFDLDPWQFLPVFFIGFAVSGGKEVISYLGLSQASHGAV